jgi:hypothetical protein
MNNLRVIASLCAVLGVATIAGCEADVTVTDPGPDSTLRVQNNSDFAIEDLRVTSVGSSSWGSNLLGNDSLLPGEAITLDVNCGTYDAMLVDEDGVTCELNSVDLCLNDASWVIRNNTCTVFGAAKAAREAAAAAAAANPATGSASTGSN